MFDFPREGHLPRLGATWVTGSGELCCIHELDTEELRKSSAAILGLSFPRPLSLIRSSPFASFYSFFPLCFGGKLKRDLFLVPPQGRSEKSIEIMKLSTLVSS